MGGRRVPVVAFEQVVNATPSDPENPGRTCLFPPTDAKVRKISSASTSFSEAPRRTVKSGAVPSLALWANSIGKSPDESIDDRHRITARSMTLRNSRTLPGHE
jgi:hypothetical protein